MDNHGPRGERNEAELLTDTSDAKINTFLHHLMVTKCGSAQTTRTLSFHSRLIFNRFQSFRCTCLGFSATTNKNIKIDYREPQRTCLCQKNCPQPWMWHLLNLSIWSFMLCRGDPWDAVAGYQWGSDLDRRHCAGPSIVPVPRLYLFWKRETTHTLQSSLMRNAQRSYRIGHPCSFIQDENISNLISRQCDNICSYKTIGNIWPL